MEILHWFYLSEGEYYRLEAGIFDKIKDDLIRRQVFPGLHLAVTALLAGDLAAVLAAVGRETETEEHAAFVERLTQKA